MLRQTISIIYALLTLAACSSWSTESKLREGGPTPYIRCLAAPAPSPRQGQLGSIGFSLQDRSLTLRPKRWPLRIAAFSGAGFGAAPHAADVSRLRHRADVLLMLGGVGESEAVAETSIRTLASLGTPALVLFGGRDRFSARDLLDKAGKGIIDITPIRRILIAGNTLVPVAGADQGRYSASAEACGFASKDLEAIAAELGTAGSAERRWLISWQAAAGTGPVPGAAAYDHGLDLGSPRLGRFVQQIGAVGGLCAWPAGPYQELPPGPLAARVVPRLFGPRLSRSDGTRVEPGFMMIELDDQGLRVLE